MESPDYPITHFAEITAIAKALKPLPAQILEHRYLYSSFGSWWLVVRHRGVPLRIVLDGKEQILRIERSTSKDEPFSWGTVVSQRSVGTAVKGDDLARAVAKAAG